MVILIHVKNAIVTIIARVIIIIKKVICIFPQNRYKEFHEKIIKSYFKYILHKVFLFIAKKY